MSSRKPKISILRELLEKVLDSKTHSDYVKAQLLAQYLEIIALRRLEQRIQELVNAMRKTGTTRKRYRRYRGYKRW